MAEPRQARQEEPEHELVVVPAGDGEVLGRSSGRVVQTKLDVDELALTESRYEEGQKGPSDHFHREHHDCFYLLEGELTFVVEGETLRVGEGGFAAVPPMAVHTFRNEGPGQARFLNMHAPSKGFIEYLRALRDAGSDEDRRRAIERFDSYDA
jgi:mannose-6-phosphate isomerase-like protein (cupin superfamily)